MDFNDIPYGSEVRYHRLGDPSILAKAFPEAPAATWRTNINCIWFVAELDGFPMGACCAEIKGVDEWTFRSAYIHPMFRDEGIYEELCAARSYYINEYHRGSAVMQYPETWREGGVYDHEPGVKNSLIAFWPTPETTDLNFPMMEQHYRALACTYEMDMQIVHKPSQIIVGDKRPWISIEEYREESPGVRYDQFEYPEEAIYIVGNSDWRFMSDIVEVDHVINVPTPGGFEHPLYGNQVAAIVLQQLSQQREERCGTSPISS